VHLRREHHTFPIRPYLPLLVESLEDTDAHVRDCARQSVVELFSGPAVTDAARADLKKEMTKKGVRKTIVDGVLSKLLAGGGNGVASAPDSRDGSENGDLAQSTSKREYIPPSLALKKQMPSTTGTSMPRSFSQSSIKDNPRPLSRAASSAPMTPTAESANDVETVYVSALPL
jgi:CLIP-associating protein 1/2